MTKDTTDFIYSLDEASVEALRDTLLKLATEDQQASAELAEMADRKRKKAAVADARLNELRCAS